MNKLLKLARDVVAYTSLGAGIGAAATFAVLSYPPWKQEREDRAVYNQFVRAFEESAVRHELERETAAANKMNSLRLDLQDELSTYRSQVGVMAQRVIILKASANFNEQTCDRERAKNITLSATDKALAEFDDNVEKGVYKSYPLRSITQRQTDQEVIKRHRALLDANCK